MDEWHIDLLQQSRYGFGSIVRVLDDQPEQVRHVLEGVAETGDFRQLLRAAICRRDNVQWGQHRLVFYGKLGRNITIAN